MTLESFRAETWPPRLRARADRMLSPGEEGGRTAVRTPGSRCLGRSRARGRQNWGPSLRPGAHVLAGAGRGWEWGLYGKTRSWGLGVLCPGLDVCPITNHSSVPLWGGAGFSPITVTAWVCALMLTRCPWACSHQRGEGHKAREQMRVQDVGESWTVHGRCTEEGRVSRGSTPYGTRLIRVRTSHLAWSLSKAK